MVSVTGWRLGQEREHISCDRCNRPVLLGKEYQTRAIVCARRMTIIQLGKIILSDELGFGTQKKVLCSPSTSAKFALKGIAGPSKANLR